MGMGGRLPLIVFSHLRWDFVWQRPQHLISRFAHNRRVLFVEEPIFEEDAPVPAEAGLRTREESGVLVAQPVCKDPLPGNGIQLDDMYARLMPELLEREGLAGHEYVAWFYSPMFLPALRDIHPTLIVYDAMDELSLFRNAPAELLPRERRLLEAADVVFTGGVSLGKAKAQVHGNVHAHPSGVEVEHYQQALADETAVPADLAALPQPRLGFFGVIDERIDLSLLEAVATARPDWHLAMLGPVVKISPEDLPRLPNIHYLGQKQYRDLPGYVKGFDVCLMPFALNDSTRFISPTKTLEYMAAHKPIVSTPVADVVGSYTGAVRIADSPQAFVQEVEAALTEMPAEREARVARERAILARNTWEAIAEHMDRRMAEARARRAAGAAAARG